MLAVARASMRYDLLLVPIAANGPGAARLASSGNTQQVSDRSALDTNHRIVCGESKTEERSEKLCLSAICLMDALTALSFSNFWEVSVNERVVEKRNATRHCTSPRWQTRVRVCDRDAS